MVYNRNEHRDGNAVVEGDGDDNDEDACFYSWSPSVDWWAEVNAEMMDWDLVWMLMVNGDGEDEATMTRTEQMMVVMMIDKNMWLVHWDMEMVAVVVSQSLDWTSSEVTIRPHQLDSFEADTVHAWHNLKSNEHGDRALLSNRLKPTIFEFFIDHRHDISIIQSVSNEKQRWLWPPDRSAQTYPIISTTRTTKFSSFAFDCIIVANKSHQIHFCSTIAWLFVAAAFRECWDGGTMTFICNRTTFNTSCCRDGTKAERENKWSSSMQKNELYNHDAQLSRRINHQDEHRDRAMKLYTLDSSLMFVAI